MDKKIQTNTKTQKDLEKYKATGENVFSKIPEKKMN